MAIYTTGLHIAKYLRRARISWRTGPFRLHDSVHDSPSPCRHSPAVFWTARGVCGERAAVYEIDTPPVVYIGSPLLYTSTLQQKIPHSTTSIVERTHCKVDRLECMEYQRALSYTVGSARTLRASPIVYHHGVHISSPVSAQLKT